MTLATWVTVLRILLLLPFGILIAADAQLLAAAVLGIAATSDFLDGYLARSRNAVSALGTALDPIADKILIIGALFVLQGSGALSSLQGTAAVVIICREVLISGLREAAAGSFELPVSLLAKWKTTCQFIALIALVIAPVEVATVAILLACGLTVWTGAEYVRIWIQASSK